ncbi:hypothetical protein PHLCEN_2v2929 [Hermanssonia centrifuga]|uniref:Acetoacetate decarboxylase n=1 Tax=Hermanssonia centrifuga TaxID=98765 RepID=A0A2R6RID5_9APHY|nr:hypothetical protein PHLCEN_2v2929 [Hermanssonia centrifuga]
MSSTAQLQDISDYFQLVPVPWKCKGESFVFATYISKKASYPSNASFNPLEAGSSFADPAVTGEFHGGLGMIMVIRYKETPVGSYDELLWIPGTFTVPPTGQRALRITRMYVSEMPTIYNGRINWSVPKTRAHFTFTPSEHGAQGVPYSRISLAPLSHPDRPFFSVDLSPTRFFATARIPFDGSMIPKSLVYVVHPPVPESLNWKEDGMVGSDQWLGCPFVMKGKAGLFWGTGGLEGGKYGDEVGFPDVRPWSLGVWIPDADIYFATGDIIGKKDV